MTPETEAEFATLVAKLTPEGVEEFIHNIETGHVASQSYHTSIRFSIKEDLGNVLLDSVDQDDDRPCGCAYGHLGFSMAGGVWSRESSSLARQQQRQANPNVDTITPLERWLVDHVILGETHLNSETLAYMRVVLIEAHNKIMESIHE